MVFYDREQARDSHLVKGKVVLCHDKRYKGGRLHATLSSKQRGIRRIFI